MRVLHIEDEHRKRAYRQEEIAKQLELDRLSEMRMRNQHQMMSMQEIAQHHQKTRLQREVSKIEKMAKDLLRPGGLSSSPKEPF